MNAKAQTEVASVFETLAAVDCSAYVEKKGKFTYLSWTFAVAELLKRYPSSTWRVIETPDGAPYWKTVAGCFVKVGVTVEGIERVQNHPILNSNNKTIENPNAFEVNTSIQRALVKAIALHGLGLYIYAGEDLPESVQAENEAKADAEREAREAQEAADVQEWIDAIDGCTTNDDLNKIGGDIAALKISSASKVKLRAAFATRKHALEKAE